MSRTPRRSRRARTPSQLYYDTAVFSTTLLRRLVEDVGSDHVLLGTDHPFELGDPTPVATVLDLSSRRHRPRRSWATTRVGYWACPLGGRGT